MNKKQLIVVWILILFFCFSLINIGYTEERALQVTTIAPSFSTRMKAREIRSRNGWIEVTPKEANYIFVVVRSYSFNPLNFSYDSYKELEEDADRLPNITGGNYHLYLYQFNNNLSVNEVEHNYFEADD